MGKPWLVSAALALLVSLSPDARAAERGVWFGVQADWGSDSDFGVGARIDVSLGFLLKGLESGASFDVFFPGDDLAADTSYWEANANLVYGFGHLERWASPYLGAGVNIARIEASVSALGVQISAEDTQTRLNLLLGFRLGHGRARPFVEARYEAGDSSQFVASIGIRF